jgi:lipid-binding SYLF domain-containing protein
MRLPIAAAVATTGVLTATLAFGQLSKSDLKHLNNATTVLSEFRNSSDIPESIWTKANCVLVIPSLKKAAFIVGGEGGSGVMSCRHSNGAWGTPVFMQLTKGSVGFQVGAQSTELVLFVMNNHGAERLLSNKTTLGTDASVAAGPVGRTAGAATDIQLTAEMLSYSHSKGLFAGVNLSGGALAPDKDANMRAYGSTASTREIALGTAPVTALAAARGFTDALARDTRATTGVKR